MASNEEAATALGWTKRLVTKNRWKLKKYGFINYDIKSNGQAVCIEILKGYTPDDESDETNDYKQDIYRQIADACLARINEPSTTAHQTIELMRELRMVLKEMQ